MRGKHLILATILLQSVSISVPADTIEAGSADERDAVRSPALRSGLGQVQPQTVSITSPTPGDATFAPEEISDAGPARPVQVAGTPLTKLSGTLVAGGSVESFAVTPDGTTAAYVASQDHPTVPELYTVPVGGGTPIKLNNVSGFCAHATATPCTPPSDAVACLGVSPTCTPATGVVGFQLSDTHAVYRADEGTLGVIEAYSVPLGGGPSVKLSSVPVTISGISPDGSTAVYFGTTAGGNIELFSVPIGGGPDVRLSNAANNPQGNVAFANFSPDSTHMYYVADEDPAFPGVTDLYSVPIGGPATNSLKLNAPVLGDVYNAKFSSDSARIVYSGDQNVFGVIELFSVSVGGPTGSGVNLSGPFPNYSDVFDFEISPDSSSVLFRADVTSNGDIEAFSRSIDGTGPVNLISGTMTPGGDAITQNVTGDSVWGVYGGDQDLDEADELYSRRMDGSGDRNKLHETVVSGDGVGNLGSIGTPIRRNRAIYPVFTSGLAEIYSVPPDGSQLPTKLNPPLPAGGSLFTSAIPFYDDPDLVSFSGELNTVGVREGFSVPLSGSLPPQQFSAPLVAGGNVIAFQIPSTEQYVLYLADQEVDERFELYSRVIDADDDGAVNGVDNCALIPNPTQQPVVFGQTILATSRDVFSWPDRADAKYVRGPLDMAGSYVTDDSGSLIEADSYVDATEPAAGEGSYYVFALDCPGGSYETAVGDQPGRGVLP